MLACIHTLTYTYIHEKLYAGNNNRLFQTVI